MIENENQKEENIKDVNQSSNKEKLILVLLFAVAVGIIAGAGYFLWEKLKPPAKENKASIKNLSVEIVPEQKNEQKNEKEEEVKKEENKKIVEDKKISLADLSVKVLNAGAPTGSAGKIKNLLIAKGYKKTQADNAKSGNYSGIIIYHKNEFQDQAQEIKEMLSKIYKTIEIKKVLNEKEITGDVVIIIGK